MQDNGNTEVSPVGEILHIIKVDDTTGEAVQRTYEGKYRVKVISENSVAAFKEKADGSFDVHKGERFLKLYPARVSMLSDEDLSYGELKALLAVLSFYVKYQTCELVHGNSMPVRGDDIISKAGLSERGGYKNIAELERRGIIAKNRDSLDGRKYVYFANPFIFMCGSSVSFDAVHMFHKTKWAQTPLCTEVVELSGNP